MAESEEALQLKRRARRRLVGALALVTFVVIILPLLLDKEPGPAGPPLDVQIPRSEVGGLASRAGPPAAQLPAVPAPERIMEASPAKPEALAVNADAPANKAELPPVKTGPSAASAQTPSGKAEPVAVREPAKLPGKTDEMRAETALNDQAWVVTLDAFSDKKNVTQLQSKLSAAGVKSYTEPVKTSKGELTRVRAGPFASKEAAEKARAKLDSMGLKPGLVASR